MKAIMLASAAFAAAAGTAFAQEGSGMDAELRQQVRAAAEAALESDQAWEITESLTTEIGPRLPGSPDEARARKWGVQTLERLGFENVHVETFQVPYWTRGETTVRVAAPFEQDLVATALGHSVPTPEGGITGEIAMFDSVEALSGGEESLEGRIAFVNMVMERTRDGSGYGEAGVMRNRGAIEAARRGAEALLIRSVGTDHNRTPHQGVMGYEEGVEKIPAAALSVPDAEQLARMVELGEPVTVSLTITAEHHGVRESGNVVGEIPGTENPEEIVLVGGHLDSWDLGTGAIDDAAGIAISTAAADLVAEEFGPAKRTIRVVMFGSEEIGLFGGRAYAQENAAELDNIVAAAESDFGAGRVWKISSEVAADAYPVIEDLQEELAFLDIEAGGNESAHGSDLGDMKRAGVPIIQFHQDGTDYFDYHHTANDTLDKVDPEALAQNTAAYAGFIWAAANAEADFRKDDESSDGEIHTE